MKRVKYLGGGFTDDYATGHEFKLTIGKIYEVLNEDHHYMVTSDSGMEMYEDKSFFSIVPDDTIFHPDEIQPGKLYVSNMPTLVDRVIYMGIEHYDKSGKYLVVVVDDDDISVGVIVSTDLTLPIWKEGFTLKGGTN